MSLLERLGGGHLSDATFARLWADESAGAGRGGHAAQERSGHAHLAACGACRERYAAFGAWMVDVADELRDEADELLTPERMAAQQTQIARRLEAVDRPVRVIAFPKAARAVISGHSHVRRWVTVAAAASLIAGFGLGQIVPLRSGAPQRSSGHAPVAAAKAPVPMLTRPVTQELAKDLVPVSDAVTEEEPVLSDSFARSHVSTLSALDDMTPHARDIVLNRRNKQYK